MRGCVISGESGVGVGGELEQSVLPPVLLRLGLPPGLRSELWQEAIMWALIWSRGRKAAIFKTISVVTCQECGESLIAGHLRDVN